MAKILLVANDVPSRDALAGFLTARGHSVAQSSKSGMLGAADVERPAAVLLIGETADGDTFAACRAMRDRGRWLLLLVVESASAEDRVAAFEAGADDVVAGADIAPAEIDARLRAMLRRAQPELSPETIVVGDLRVDRARHRVTRAGEEIPLTLTEFNLLEYLARRKNIALTRKEIVAAVWGGNVEGFTNIVDVYVNYLRKKIERSDRPRLIKTVRGVGYLLEEPESAPADIPASM